MPKYFCKNCFNFKDRTIKKKHLGGISKYKIQKAIKGQNIPLLGFTFPFNMTVYKRVMRHRECRIFYCAQHLLKRELYVDRDNFEKISCGMTPCPKYKPVYEKNSR